MPDIISSPESSIEELRDEVARLRLIHAIGLEFSTSLDFDELLPRIFHRVLEALGAEGGSLWIAEDEELCCRLAEGRAGKKLVGARVPIGTGFVGDVAQRPRTTIVTRAVEDPRYQPALDSGEALATTVMATAMVSGGVTVGSIQVANKLTGDGIFDQRDRELLEGLAASAAAALRNAQLHSVESRARDLALLLEISREITATLDLDRVLRSVVNLASQALPFDRGAVGLYQKGQCEIRAVAGQEKVDPDDPKLQDLIARAAWAAGHGEQLYLCDRTNPASDAERMFVSIFGPDLESDGVESGLYLPLKDEEGVVGVLVFESGKPDLATESQLEVAAILANQTAVALRNAQLYHEVPMVDALGALAAKKKALSFPAPPQAAAVPRRCPRRPGRIDPVPLAPPGVRQRSQFPAGRLRSGASAGGRRGRTAAGQRGIHGLPRCATRDAARHRPHGPARDHGRRPGSGGALRRAGSEPGRCRQSSGCSRSAVNRCARSWRCWTRRWRSPPFEHQQPVWCSRLMSASRSAARSRKVICC